MSNNIIDDMLKNQVPKKTKKSGFKAFLLFLLFLLLLVAVGFVAYMYLKDQKKVTPKDTFIQYLGKSNFSNVFNFEKIDSLNTRLQSEDSEATTEISGNTSGLISTGDIDLSDILLEVNSKNKPKDDKLFSESVIKYKDNDIVDFDILSVKNRLGLFSKDILTKYIGSKYSNLDRIFSKFLSSNENKVEFNFDFGLLKNSKLVMPKISDEILKKYVDIVNQKVSETAFSSKRITLERTSGTLDVTEYSMTLNEEQTIELVDQVLQTLENDDELLDMLLASIGDEEIRQQLKDQIKSRN